MFCAWSRGHTGGRGVISTPKPCSGDSSDVSLPWELSGVCRTAHGGDLWGVRGASVLGAAGDRDSQGWDTLQLPGALQRESQGSVHDLGGTRQAKKVICILNKSGNLTSLEGESGTSVVGGCGSGGAGVSGLPWPCCWGGQLFLSCLIPPETTASLRPARGSTAGHI